MARFGACLLLLTVSSAQTPEQGLKIQSGIFAPRPISKPDPSYTEEARKARASGIVKLHCVVREDGRAHDIKILNPMGMGLDENAVQALEEWTFRPGKRDGVPVRVQATIEMNFHLPSSGPQWQIARLVFQGNPAVRPMLKQSPRPHELPANPGTRVIAHLKVDDKGKIVNVVAEQRTDPATADPLLKAVQKWRFMMPEHPDPSGYEATLELVYHMGR